jgi:hypothetical protein
LIAGSTDYGTRAGLQIKIPHDYAEFLRENMFGSDGGRSLVGLLILAAFDDVLNRRIVGIISQRIT